MKIITSSAILALGALSLSSPHNYSKDRLEIQEYIVKPEPFPAGAGLNSRGGKKRRRSRYDIRGW